MDGPKDPWSRVLSLPGQFVGDPASLACDNIYKVIYPHIYYYIKLNYDVHSESLQDELILGSTPGEYHAFLQIN